jgi:hypothetical protein
MQDLNIPMDTEISLTAEGDEVEILRELSGVCVLHQRCALSLLICSVRHRQRHDPRTWDDRIRTREKKWTAQIEALTDAYLHWKSSPSDVGAEGDEFTVEYVDIYGQPCVPLP